MSEYDLEEPLSSTTRPLTDAVLTVRIIKSFPYRNVHNYIFRHIDLVHTTAKQLYDKIISTINSEGQLRPYRNVKYDTIKIYVHAHGTKTMNLVINMDHDDDEWVLDINDNKKSLAEYSIENETELSIYNKQAYLEYKKNPINKW